MIIQLRFNTYFHPLFSWQGRVEKNKKNAPMQIKFETSKFAAIFFPCITKTYLSSQGRQGYSSFFFLFRFLFWFDTIINPIVNSIRSQLRHTTKCCLMINQAEKSSSAVKAKIGTPRYKDKKVESERVEILALLVASGKNVANTWFGAFLHSLFSFLFFQKESALLYIHVLLSV